MAPPSATALSLRPSYELETWQEDAVSAWRASRNAEGLPRHGILHVYTGAGKTVLAAAAMARARQDRPRTKFAIVVPTEALAAQWVEIIPRMTTMPAHLVGQVGGERSDGFDECDALVFILASAQKLVDGRSRLAREADGHEVMLVVDECHRAGAGAGQKIFDVGSWARLGLSATPIREDPANTDIYGRPLPIEKQPHGRGIGPICYKRDLRDGIREGCLPRFELLHHAVGLTEAEQKTYDDVHEQNIQRKRKALLSSGGNPRHYQAYISGRMRAANPGIIQAAKELQQAFFARKQFLYTASERIRVAGLVLEDAFAHGEDVASALIFNERVGDRGDTDDGSFGAEELAELLREAAEEGMFPFGPEAIAVEHSRMPRTDRLAAVEGLRSRDVRILVSVKALQEGLDVPDVGMGLSVASTASGRQRIQTMGRVLRPPRDRRTGRRLDPADHPVKQLHFFYVRNSPDEELYRKESWGELFTAANNRWVEWDVGADEGEDGNPLKPPPSEEEAWAAIKADPFPARWHGPSAGLTLSWKKIGASIPGSDHPLDNKAEVEAQLRATSVPLGQVLVTPNLGVILSWGNADAEGKRPVLAWGRMRLDVTDAEGSADAGMAAPSPVPDATELDGSRERSIPRIRPEELEGLLETSIEGQWWYELVQRACIAWVEEDDATFDAAIALLERRSGRARLGRSLLRALLDPPGTIMASTSGPTIPLLEAYGCDPFRMGHEEKARLGAAAALAGRYDVVRKVADEFHRIGSLKGKLSMLGLANALRILAGDSRDVLVVDSDGD
jgi:superfamily II DNA or RNA helicase